MIILIKKTNLIKFQNLKILNKLNFSIFNFQLIPIKIGKLLSLVFKRLNQI